MDLKKTTSLVQLFRWEAQGLRAWHAQAMKLLFGTYVLQKLLIAKEYEKAHGLFTYLHGEDSEGVIRYIDRIHPRSQIAFCLGTKKLEKRRGSMPDIADMEAACLPRAERFVAQAHLDVDIEQLYQDWLLGALTTIPPHPVEEEEPTQALLIAPREELDPDRQAAEEYWEAYEEEYFGRKR